MAYRWNHKVFGRQVGDVETEKQIAECRMALDTLLAAGIVTETKAKSKRERDDDKEGDTSERP